MLFITNCLLWNWFLVFQTSVFFVILIGSCPVTHMLCVVSLECARNEQYGSDKIILVHLMCVITAKLFYCSSFGQQCSKLSVDDSCAETY